MKIRKLFFGMMASAAVLVSCQEKEENLGVPEITLDPTTLEFGQQGGVDNAKTLTVTSTRDWTIEQDENEKWVTFSPASGSASSEPQTVTVTVTDNNESDRTATIVFKAATVRKELTVKQTGPGGAVEDTYVYFNDFDKEVAQKGNSGWDTYLDTFDGWHNESGTGVGAVVYNSSGVSARTLSKDSASDMSLYDGSGINNVFFGKDAFFEIGKIALDADVVNYTVSFGSERYDGNAGADNTFNHDEFQVYISNDGAKWVEIEYTFAQGSDPVGKWDLASSTFTVPSGTAELYIYFNVTAASVYRIDDLKLVASGTAGTEIDFSQGVEIGGGDEPVEPSDPVKVTIAEFLAAPESDNVYYILTGEITDLYNTEYGNFTLVDETGSVKVYGLTAEKQDYNDKSFSTLGLKEGDIVTLCGTRDSYGDEDQVGGPSYYISHEPGGEEPEEPDVPAEGYLIISEYVEGSSNNKYIEVFNPTESTIALDENYQLMCYANGATSPQNTFDMTGSIAPGAVIVYKNSQAEVYTGEATVCGACNFNGDDAIVLAYKGQAIDVMGVIGERLKFGENVTLRRVATVTVPSATYNESEWESFDSDDVSGLGSHAVTE